MPGDVMARHPTADRRGANGGIWYLIVSPSADPGHHQDEDQQGEDCGNDHSSAPWVHRILLRAALGAAQDLRTGQRMARQRLIPGLPVLGTAEVRSHERH